MAIFLGGSMIANPLPSWVPINWDLISHPVNWLVVILMLAIAGFALHLLLPQEFAGPQSQNASS